VKFWGINGKVEFRNTKVERGMIKIGVNSDCFNIPHKSGYIALNARALIIFEGKAIIGVNSVIRVNSDGILHFHKYVYLGSGVRIFCNGGEISIGEYSQITYETVFMNSGYHYIHNTENNSVHRRTKPIRIGAYNWIGNRTTLSGGCITKDFTIICSGSIVNKDFSKIDDNHLMLAGVPAKKIASGLKRIFSPELEVIITRFFDEHPEKDIYKPEKLIIDNMAELEKEF